MTEAAEKGSSRQIRVAAEDLELGMYVSALDRPWLETDFLFQGFEIQDQDDIDALRRQCEHVYIDPERTDQAVNTQLLQYKAAAAEAENDALARTAEIALRRAPHRKKPQPAHSGTSQYTNVRQVRRELAEAKERHDAASGLVREVLDNLSAGGKLDVKTAKRAVEPIVDSVTRNHSALSWLVRMRATDEYMYSHSVSSAIWATVMARQIGMPKDVVESVGLGAMLLDVGKTRLPKDLVIKPDKLSAEEMRLVRQHVELGVEILEETDGATPEIVAMVQTHHERHDGSGYPAGLKGQQIPVFGRIAGIVDFYDAVTSERPYARARSTYDCLRALNLMAGKTFQKELVEQFIQSIGFFPPGTLVQLNDESVAVVIAQNRRHRLKPEVLLVLDAEHNMCTDFPIIDLQLDVKSVFTGEVLHIDKGLKPGSFGIDPAEYFLS